MSKQSAKQLVMTPLYRQRVVKAKKGKGSYCRKQKPRTEFRGFCFLVAIAAVAAVAWGAELAKRNPGSSWPKR